MPNESPYYQAFLMSFQQGRNISADESYLFQVRFRVSSTVETFMVTMHEHRSGGFDTSVSPLTP